MAGNVVEVKQGATTTIVKMEVPSLAHVTASITNDAADELCIAAGDTVVVIVNSSEVIIGT